MTQNTRTVLIYIAAFVCFIIAFLLAADWLLHDGNLTAFAMAGSALFVAGHISEKLP